jgi:toxin ParE1/3/4
MSSPKYQLYITARAASDHDAILQYTLEKWGEAQANYYGAMLTKTMDAVCNNPLSSQAKPEISNDTRVILAGSHVIVYRVCGSSVYISRILHARMDIKQHI